MNPPTPQPDLLKQLTERRAQLRVGLVGAALIGLMGLIDYGLTARNIAWPIYYLVPILGVAWFGSWRLSLLAVLLSAVINLGIDLAFAAQYANPTLIHLSSAATFLVALAAARGMGTLRLMVDYYQNRGEVWKAITKPFRVGKHLIIVPAPEKGQPVDESSAGPGDILLILDPGLAFGAGEHATTNLCLALLETYVKPGDRVFDLGCGSGILSIAAVKLGARSVLAVDIDPEAERATRVNAELNGVVDKIDVRLGSLELAFDAQGSTGKASSAALAYQVTVANILTDVVIQVLNAGLAQTITSEGTLILSGIRAEKAARVMDALKIAGLKVIEQHQVSDWLAIVTQRA